MNFLFEGLIHGVNLLKEGGWFVKGKLRTVSGGRRTEGRVWGQAFLIVVIVDLFFGTPVKQQQKRFHWAGGFHGLHGFFIRGSGFAYCLDCQ